VAWENKPNLQKFFWAGVVLLRGCCGGVSVSAGGSSDSAVIDSRYRTRAAARFVSWEGSSSSHDPFFSREVAFPFSLHQILPFWLRDRFYPLTVLILLIFS
jgi:hypothetical protein